MFEARHGTEKGQSELSPSRRSLNAISQDLAGIFFAGGAGFSSLDKLFPHPSPVASVRSFGKTSTLKALNGSIFQVHGPARRSLARERQPVLLLLCSTALRPRLVVS